MLLGFVATKQCLLHSINNAISFANEASGLAIASELTLLRVCFFLRCYPRVHICRMSLSTDIHRVLQHGYVLNLLG